jgi:hypothetical protein
LLGFLFDSEAIYGVNIAQFRTLHSHFCKNLKSNSSIFVFFFKILFNNTVSISEYRPVVSSGWIISKF